MGGPRDLSFSGHEKRRMICCRSKSLNLCPGRPVRGGFFREIGACEKFMARMIGAVGRVGAVYFAIVALVAVLLLVLAKFGQ